jgi:hypothetical protein
MLIANLAGRLSRQGRALGSRDRCQLCHPAPRPRTRARPSGLAPATRPLESKAKLPVPLSEHSKNLNPSPIRFSNIWLLTANPLGQPKVLRETVDLSMAIGNLKMIVELDVFGMQD